MCRTTGISNTASFRVLLGVGLPLVGSVVLLALAVYLANTLEKFSVPFLLADKKPKGTDRLLSACVCGGTFSGGRCNCNDTLTIFVVVRDVLIMFVLHGVFSRQGRYGRS